MNMAMCRYSERKAGIPAAPAYGSRSGQDCRLPCYVSIRPAAAWLCGPARSARQASITHPATALTALMKTRSATSNLASAIPEPPRPPTSSIRC